jgi:hypothetical protein
LEAVPDYLEISMKLRCRRCEQDLDAEANFYPRKGTKTGYQYECIACRKEINKKYKKPKGRGRPKGSVDKKPRCPRGMARDKEGYRKNLINEAATRIPLGQPIAETPRTFNFTLRLIIEQQLAAFYGKGINTAAGKVKLQKVLDDTMFEVRDALTRATHRAKAIERTEAKDGDMMIDVLKQQKERQEALAMLQLKEGASLDEIKHSYRKLAQVAHPDHGGDTDQMSRLNSALSILTEGQNGHQKAAENHN